MTLAWQDRNAIAERYPFSALASADVTIVDPTPPLAPGVLSDFGDFGLPQDGIDAIITDMLGSIVGDISAIDGLASIVGALSVVPGAIAAETIDPVATDMAKFDAGTTPAVEAWAHNAATWKATVTKTLFYAPNAPGGSGHPGAPPQPGKLPPPELPPDKKPPKG